MQVIVLCPVSRFNPESIDSMLNLDGIPLFYLLGRSPIVQGFYDHYRRVKFIANARNALLERALKLEWDYALLLDDDIVVSSATLRMMIKHADAEKVIAIPYIAKEDPGRTLTMPGPDPKYAKHTGFGCILIAREVFEKVGMFNTDFSTPDMSEDVDYCNRINEAGYRIFILDKQNLVKHDPL